MTTPNLFPQLGGPPPLTEPILPKHLPCEVPRIVSAYAIALDAELAAVEDYVRCQTQPKAVRDVAARHVVTSRVVGFLFSALLNMEHCLGITPIHRIATEVTSASNHTEIYAVGTRYIDHLICSFRTNTSATRPPSTHPSRPSMTELEDMLVDAIKTSAADHSSARTRALARDAFHCMVTNTINAHSFYKHDAIKKLQSQTGAAVRLIQTCHIFNESVLQNIEVDAEFPQEPRRQRAAGAMGILKMFGLTEVVKRLTSFASADVASASGVHDLSNILSLSTELHSAFDELKLAFEPVSGKQNTYDIIFAYPQAALGLFGLKNRITLTNFADPSKFKEPAGGLLELPLPSSELLALHAVCARVAHMSGAAQALDDLDRDLEDTQVLAKDGGSANLLHMMLSPLVSATA
ncbi:hypothetical protein R3P38DRAFT_3099115 [Favolaschia claudopus]|uniref:HNH nuclease domain-containing protein n=1 Tax=Favolaschia claudopus TaxID=2862362 RepID=A0AAV9ZMZ0_9AGAR